MQKTSSLVVPVLSACTMLAGALISPASAQTVPTANYYVSSTGNDANAGTSTSAAFKTIGKALSVVSSGQKIAVASGTYPSFTDKRTRTSTVTVIGYGSTKPIVTTTGSADGYAGAFAGAQYLTFDNFKFQGTVRIASPTTTDSAGNTTVTQTCKNITVRNCDISAGVAIYIVKGSQNITIDNNYIHDSGYGIFNNGQPVVCDNIKITNNLIENLTTDGIQFCRWNNVLIDGNIIRNIHRVSGDLHNDAIQLSGVSDNVTIINNVMADSTTQLLMVKEDFGQISNLSVKNNLIYDAGAVAVQISKVSGLNFINNTVWNRGYGGYDGMYLRGAETSNAVIANNVFSTFRKLDGATVVYEDYNMSTQTGLYGPHDIRVNPDTAPLFQDVAGENFHPVSNAAFRNKATPLYATIYDLDGVTRSTTTPTMGAYETPGTSGALSDSAQLASYSPLDQLLTPVLRAVRSALS